MADDVASLSYEAALAELDTIISQLERGDIALEAAIASYERGMTLSRHCASLLDATEQKVTQLVVSNRGEVETPLQMGDLAAAPAAEPSLPRARTAEQALFGDPPPAATRGRGGGPPIDPEEIPF